MRLFVALVTAVLLWPSETHGQAAAPATTDAVRSVEDALASHDIVLLSEEHYGIQFHGFLHQLLADSRLAGRVNDIVVECGNPRYQDVVDRYVAGEDVPRSAIRQAWRNTSQILAWDSPLYEELYDWIRTVNSGLKPEQRFRVVLMEPAIDWSKVKTAKDYQPFAQRSREQLAHVESEVIAKKHKAIIVVGGAHVLRRSLQNPKTVTPLENASLGDALARKYPGRSYSIWTVPGGATLTSEVVPQIVPLAGSSLASRSFGDAAPAGIMVQRNGEWVKLTSGDWPPLSDMCDAVLFLGPRTKAEPPRSAFSDPAYYKELLRRAKIMSDVYGFDLVTQVHASR